MGSWLNNALSKYLLSKCTHFLHELIYIAIFVHAQVLVILYCYCNIVFPQHGIVLQNQFAELCHICRNGQLDLLKEFLYYNKEILNYSTPKGNTILHEAVEGDQPDVVQLLLLHGLHPDMRAKGGLTPLHLAVTRAQIGCVRTLIENGADISIRDQSGQDAIAKAELRSKKREAILKLLRSKGKIMDTGNIQIMLL